MIHPDLIDAGALLAGLQDDPRDLEQQLYIWYLARTPLPPSPVAIDLGSALDAAHHDATRYVGGWRATATTEMGGAIARSGDLIRHVSRACYTVPARPGLPARVGDALLVRAAWTWRDTETGFWHTRRGPWPPRADDLTRTYLNVSPYGAPHAIAALTRLLAAHRQVSYQLKTPLSGDHGGRADAVVLYLGTRDAEALDADLRAAVDELGWALRPVRPRFTSCYAPGVGQAQGTLDGESFGEARCDLLARTWRSMPPASRRDPDTVTRALTAAFHAARIDPARPYLLPARTAAQTPARTAEPS